MIDFRFCRSAVFLVIITMYLSAFAPLALENRSTFGKTHFILGHQGPKVKEKNQAPTAHALLAPDGSIKHAFFSPDHNIRDVFIQLVENEDESIKTAIYFFTERLCAQALVAAFERGVNVEIITDQSCIDCKHNKIYLLTDHSVPVYVFDGKKIKSGPYASLMHNKFALFKKNIAGKSILWTGSFNLTRTATTANQENVVLLDDKDLFKKFDQQFELVKGRCGRHDAPLVVAENRKKKPRSRAKRIKIEYLGDLPALLV